MAIVDRVFYVNHLCGMDYNQSSDHFIQRNGQSGGGNSPFFTAAVSGLNQVNNPSMTDGLNIGDARFSVHSNYIPSTSTTVASENQFVWPLQNPQDAELFSLEKSAELPVSFRRKHRLEDQDTDCPVKKRRLAELPVNSAPEPCPFTANTYMAENTSERRWIAASPNKKEDPVLYSNTSSSAIAQTIHSEEMEEAAESFCNPPPPEQQEIEKRLIVADEDIKEKCAVGNFPKLIMSDLLKESLKNGFEECFTKKIVDSMNRPSMELVLWKPQPKSLIDRLQAASRKCKKDTEARKDISKGSESVFIQKAEAFRENETSSNDEAMWSREDEEMEH
ncbi:coiled-coil domain-containing protein 117 isoform X2 [Bombina bombina]|uniref:coiled-coil domain-containing protein 117 isoform X2 n=1 Tax=Bombina bombina TaxID=8345 RepID=UPI00235B08A4|nr:coiled-coil domain-containing protein 117 isoform X2 [Bombina bombina]